MNFSTTPPYRPITTRHCAKYVESSSRTSSASLLSDSGVKPTRSPNSTEVTRRSATGRSLPGPEGAFGEAPSSSAPQLAAEPAPLGRGAAGGAGTGRDGVPHSRQNLAPGGSGSAHAAQLLTRPPLGRYRRPAPRR